MKNYFYRNAILVVFCAVFVMSVYSQKKIVEPKKTPAPAARTKFQLSKLELAVVEELNEARKNPQKYAGYLEEQRKAMHGKIIKMPNQPDVHTIEGAAAIEEAVKDLNAVGTLEDFRVGEGLTGVARAQLADLQENSALGHLGKDGSDLKARLTKFGAATGKCAENICHRGRTAREVVTVFLVDDGVKERSHRKAVLSHNFKQIGVACGTGKNAESLCVVVFANNFKEKTSATIVEY